jgi:hypothetical protein
MRLVSIQFQPDRVDREDEATIVGHLRAFSTRRGIKAARFDEGQHDGRYINLTFGARSLAVAWKLVRGLLVDPDVGRAARDSFIVTCQGDRGWDDYLLLHLFDPTEALDHV